MLATACCSEVFGFAHALARAQLASYLLKAGEPPSRAHALLISLDTNRDGCISLKEWRHGWAAGLMGPGLQTPRLAWSPPSTPANGDARGMVSVGMSTVCGSGQWQPLSQWLTPANGSVPGSEAYSDVIASDIYSNHKGVPSRDMACMTTNCTSDRGHDGQTAPMPWT